MSAIPPKTSADDADLRTLAASEVHATYCASPPCRRPNGKDYAATDAVLAVVSAARDAALARVEALLRENLAPSGLHHSIEWAELRAALSPNTAAGDDK